MVNYWLQICECS